jgi:hypothetical protein
MAVEKGRRRYVARGGYVDLDKEVVRDANGVRITEAYVEAALKDVEAYLERRAGRPALGAPGTRAPAIAVRLPRELKLELDERAKSEGRRPSELVREAVAQYLLPDRRKSPGRSH